MLTQADRLQWRQQLAAIQAQRKAARRARFKQSKVDRFQAELEDLKGHGASLTDLAYWLSLHKGMKVHPSTIGKRFKKWRARHAKEK